MFTIIIPTFNHEETVKYAIQSVLEQSVQTFEIFVVGDGASPRTKEIVLALAMKDPRIRYFDNEKGEGNGELHRATALTFAKGEYIAYLGDDDLWLPDHLATVLTQLDKYDFVHTAHASIPQNGEWHVYAGDLSQPDVQKLMCTAPYNFFGPSAVAHRLDAYLALPFGWRVKPQKLWSDLHMWRQWLNQDGINFHSINKVTALHLGAKTRKNMSSTQRCEEMQYWLGKIHAGNFNEFVTDKMLRSWQQQLSQSVLTRYRVKKFKAMIQKFNPYAGKKKSAI